MPPTAPGRARARARRRAATAALICGLAGCVAAPHDEAVCEGAAGDPPFAPPAVTLTDATEDAGLPGSGTECLVFTDLDGDDLPDLLVGDAFANGVVVLHRNGGDGTFAPTRLQFGTGRPTACAAGDWDNDGLRDLAIGIGGLAPQLYLRRNAGGTFADAAELLPPLRPAGSDATALTVLGFLDVDNDGLLDLYAGLSSNIQPQACTATAQDFTCTQPHARWRRAFLLRNRGGRAFEPLPDVPVHPNALAITAAGFVDWDDDGRIDLFVTQDFEANRVYLNRPDGSFAGLGPEIGMVPYNHGMGVALGDLDRDCRWDAYVADLGPHQLYFGQADGTVVDRAARVRSGNQTIADLTRFTSGWAPLAADFNRDGRLDVFVVNTALVVGNADLERVGEGQVVQGAPLQADYLLVGDGRGGFANQLVPHEPGDLPGIIIAASAVADYDGDGDLDLAEYYLAGQAEDRFRLLRNDTAGAGHHLTVRLRGVASNRDAIGARVRVFGDAGVIHTRYAHGSSGSVGQSTHDLHFGLGARAAVGDVEVRWPSGAVVRLGPQPADRLLTLEEPR